MQLIVAGGWVKETKARLDVVPSTVSEYKNIFDRREAKQRDDCTKIFEIVLSSQEVS